ncbi:SDR family oxidoreductase [Microbispora sp. H10836]|uniref:SDR family oxidoreductase n=1 Tax=Microbispora sp. H10836 TaxID=2729106 RepID=UPI001473894B|nr:SDR family oxidoreductase [Microbispora sp. H10836]
MSVVVTGGTSGIGLAIATRLAGPGRTVVLNYARDDAAASKARARVETTGAEVHVVKANLAELDGIRAFVREVRSRVTSIDQLVHSAAAGRPGPLQKQSGEDLDWSVRLNGTSIAHLIRELDDLLTAGTSVFYITSAGAVRAIPEYGMLGAPKALAEHLVRYLARELAPRGVRVNCVSPGPLDTKARREMFPDSWNERLVAQTQANPSGRGVTMDDVAGVVEAMARPEFAMVQGQVLTIDGGLTL